MNERPITMNDIRKRADEAGFAGLRRRAFLLGSLSAVSAAAFPAAASANSLRLEMILRDPAAPVSGNPTGKLTMVTFLDYNCPWCKKTAVPMRDAVLKDGDIRVVYKDWPIITKKIPSRAPVWRWRQIIRAVTRSCIMR